MTGGSSVESSNRRANTRAATGRTRRSASKYVTMAAIAPPNEVVTPTVIANVLDPRVAKPVIMAIPTTHTNDVSTV